MSDVTPLCIDRALVDALQPTLLRYARRFLGPADADDAVQATWMAALAGSATFAQRSSALTWLCGILRHRVYDQLRRQRRFELLADEFALPWPEEVLDPCDLRSTAARAVEALTGLSEAERQAVLFVDVEDQRRDVAAARLSVTRSHLRVLLFRAREKLHVRLRRQGFDARVVGILPATRPRAGGRASPASAQ